ncbi:NAD(P)-dependent oxidoreductase [Wenxinia saemankumensis]|uniref:3-hydroxyisobutyrate dehydrogenase n=1 Tax=Wenxinia saemankumensis TaxID=1447782 RepID=A0A1M6FVJ5_9RHOB|nr:NAD(P)-dependent oxidoreductase [Wenxinia saemankumensis]SHJ01736.1 hypothetical protein SAMN05444417_2527 [Wenxinia saemankumensis]
MADLPRIGFFGPGLMGHGMAANILAAGHPLTVKGNRNRAPVEDLVAKGAQEGATPRAVAEASDIVFLCLSSSPQVEGVIRGEDGILAADRPGLIVVDCTTANPVSTAALAAELAAAGMHMADAPLGRTPKEAAAGTLDAMVGASDEVFARIRPVIACWAGSVTHLGPTGSGHRMKLIMNFISTGYSALYSEALVLGARAGLAPQQVREVIGGSRMGCGFFETFMAGAVGRDEGAHRFTLANAGKDIGYVCAMGQEAGIANPMAAAVRNLYAQALATGAGERFMPFLADEIARMNGLDLEAEVAGAG